jgi:hypothetical protein
MGMSDFDEIFFKVQVFSVAFRMVMFGFWEVGSKLLGMLEGAVVWDSTSFSSYRFFLAIFDSEDFT